MTFFFPASLLALLYAVRGLGQVDSSAVLEALTAREVRDVIRMVGDDEFGKVRPEIRSAVAEMLPLAVPADEDGVEPTRAAL